MPDLATSTPIIEGTKKVTGDWVARAWEARDRCDEPGGQTPGYEELKRLRAGNAELRTGA